MSAKKTKELGALLDRLEAVYGRMLRTDDAVEAGLLALLAEHAPHLATDAVKDHLRGTFVDWNELRVAEPWDVVVAIDGAGDPAARKFAKAALKYLRSVHNVLNRCSFERQPGDPEVDLAALVAKVRGATPGAKAVCAAAATKSWLPNAEMSKVLQRLGLIGKTSSVAKAGKALEAIADPADHLRTHYLLARYAARSKEDPDPLGLGESGRKSAKKAAAEPAAAEAPAAAEKAAPSKATAASKSKSAAKSPTAKKTAAKAKAPAKAKASAKKATKKAPSTKAGKQAAKPVTKSKAAAKAGKKATKSGSSAKKKTAKSR